MAKRSSAAKRPTSALPGQRQLRVGELIRHALAGVLARGELREPELTDVIVTVPEVRLSPDLKIATCYVMPLGGKNAAGVVEALDRNRKILRTEVARQVNLKFAADLRFRVDTSFAEGARIDALLRSDPVVQRDIAAEAASVAGDEPDDN